MRAKEFLDKPTMSPEQVAAKHGVSVEYVNKQLVDGVKHEHEHTSDTAIAREIALDHLGEDPEYYNKLSKVEKVDEEDDMFAPSKDLARRMAVMIAAGKEIWVKDSRNDVWKINKVERDPNNANRWLARWDFGEFVVSGGDFELRPEDGHTYWLDPVKHINEAKSKVIARTADALMPRAPDDRLSSKNKTVRDVEHGLDSLEWEFRQLTGMDNEKLELDEGATSVLYHYTSPMPALRIMKGGEFELTSSVGSPQEAKIAPPGYPYFMSTTRSKVGDYHARTPGSHAVMFVLDGNKLSQHYKVKPVDYWEGMWQRDNSNERTREAEDRVYSKTPTIPTEGVIKEIHQLVSDQDDFRSPVIRQMAIIAKTQGIPIYFYADKQGWLLQAPNRRFNVSQLPSRFKGQPKKSMAYRSRRITPLEQWVELLYKKNKSELSQEASHLRHNLVYYGSRYPEEDNNLRIDLANARKPNDPERGLADRIIQFLRKNNMSTVDLKNAMVAKWEKAP